MAAMLRRLWVKCPSLVARGPRSASCRRASGSTVAAAARGRLAVVVASSSTSRDGTICRSAPRRTIADLWGEAPVVAAAAPGRREGKGTPEAPVKAALLSSTHAARMPAPPQEPSLPPSSPPPSVATSASHLQEGGQGVGGTAAGVMRVRQATTTVRGTRQPIPTATPALDSSSTSASTLHKTPTVVPRPAPASTRGAAPSGAGRPPLPDQVHAGATGRGPVTRQGRQPEQYIMMGDTPVNAGKKWAREWRLVCLFPHGASLPCSPKHDPPSMPAVTPSRPAAAPSSLPIVAIMWDPPASTPIIFCSTHLPYRFSLPLASCRASPL